MRKKYFFILLFRFFFGFWAKKISDFWPKNFKKLSKLTSVCEEEQFLAWIFFQNFWTVLDFLQKPLAWFSKSIVVSRIKIPEERTFLFFFSEVLSEFKQKNFQAFGQKFSRSFQNYLLRVQRNSLWLDFFF